MNLGKKHPRSDVVSFSERQVKGLWCWLGAIISDVIFDYLESRCVPGFSTVRLLLFTLWLVRNYGELFGDHGNILLFIKRWPTRSSSHRHLLLESVITVMFAKWFCNCVTLHLLVQFHHKAEFCFSPLHSCPWFQAQKDEFMDSCRWPHR